MQTFTYNRTLLNAGPSTIMEQNLAVIIKADDKLNGFHCCLTGSNTCSILLQVSPEKICGGKIQGGVSIFESQRCTFMERSGASYVSRLPFHLEAAWPLKTGALLERRLTSSERYALAQQKPCASFISMSLLNSPFQGAEPASEPPALFTMFLMSHPLDEMTPILLKVPGTFISYFKKILFHCVGQ